VAKYYLQEADWNMEYAMKEYASDLEWERKNRGAIVSHQLPADKSEGRHIQRFYEMQELRHKKDN
jgi:hypothetical protein